MSLHNQRRRSSRFWYRSILLASLAVLMLMALAAPGTRSSVANPAALHPAAYLRVMKKSGTLAPTATVTPSATPSASPTPTQTPSNTVEISGSVFYHPRYQMIPASRPPHEYLVVLDV